MSDSPLIERLIKALQCLPGVGPRSGQRMAFHLLERGREEGRRLADVLAEAMEKIGHCTQCRTFSEQALCAICANPRRDASQLCVVESPADLMAIEQGTGYRGQYFVLMGNLSPLDGVGPEELGMGLLARRLREERPMEVIIATSATVEGEATAHYLGGLIRELDLKVTRIAHGVPLGGELEYVDSGTLAHAFSGRQILPG